MRECQLHIIPGCQSSCVRPGRCSRTWWVRRRRVYARWAWAWPRPPRCVLARCSGSSDADADCLESGEDRPRTDRCCLRTDCPPPSVHRTSTGSHHVSHGSFGVSCTPGGYSLREKRHLKVHSVSKKPSHFYFLNSSVKHSPTWIIFGKHHCEETWREWLQFCPPNLNTVVTLLCEMQKS